MFHGLEEQDEPEPCGHGFTTNTDEKKKKKVLGESPKTSEGLLPARPYN